VDGYVGCDELPDLSYLDVVEYDGNDEYDDGVGLDEFQEAEYLLETNEKLSGGGRAEDKSDTQRMETVREVTEITTGEDTIDVSVLNVEAGTYAYKNVANRTKPVATTLPEEFRTKCKIPSDPLLDLPELPTKSPPFTPGERHTQDRKDDMKINKDGFLTQDEEDLVHWIIRDDEYFDPVVIPTIEHIPWVLKNIPIPRGSYNKVISAIPDKIKSKIYEPSNSFYRSRWFTDIKKDGKSLRLVHDLRPLNAVTIEDSAVPPTIDPYPESFGGHSIYTVFYIFTPLGMFRLTSIPMGYTNSTQICHGNTTFILQDEIPRVNIPSIDNIPIKGPETRFEQEDGTYETIPDKPNIHLCDDSRTVHRRVKATAVVSAPDVQMGVKKALIVGQLDEFVWTWKSIFIACGWCKVSYLPTHGNRLEHDLN